MDKVRRPKRKTLTFNLYCVFTAYNKYRNFLQPPVFFHLLYYRKTILIWHLKIQKNRNDTALILPKLSKCLLPILRNLDQILIFQHITQQFAIQFHIVHYQYPLHTNTPFLKGYTCHLLYTVYDNFSTILCCIINCYFLLL